MLSVALTLRKMFQFGWNFDSIKTFQMMQLSLVHNIIRYFGCENSFLLFLTSKSFHLRLSPTFGTTVELLESDSWRGFNNKRSLCIWYMSGMKGNRDSSLVELSSFELFLSSFPASPFAEETRTKLIFPGGSFSASPSCECRRFLAIQLFGSKDTPLTLTSVLIDHNLSILGTRLVCGVSVLLITRSERRFSVFAPRRPLLVLWSLLICDSRWERLLG